MVTVVRLVQRKLGKHSGRFLGCKVTEMVVAACQEWVAEGPGSLPCPGLAHSQGQMLIQQHKVAEVPGLLSLQEVANASTLERSGVA